jgi:hypothetical protein
VRSFWLCVLLPDGLLDDSMVNISPLVFPPKRADRLRLLRYTPGTSIVRLTTAAIINYICVAIVRERSGSNAFREKQLPIWFLIATVRQRLDFNFEYDSIG